MPTYFRRFIEPTHPGHYTHILLAGWLISMTMVFPTVMYPNQWLGSAAGFLTAAGPIVAHAYSLRALWPLRKNRKLHPTMLPALATLCYLPAVLICLSFVRWKQALILPLTGAILAVLSFGLLFPGLAPFLAYAINHRLVRPHQSRLRLAIASLIFIAAWVLAGITAEVIASV